MFFVFVFFRDEGEGVFVRSVDIAKTIRPRIPQLMMVSHAFIRDRFAEEKPEYF